MTLAEENEEFRELFIDTATGLGVSKEFVDDLYVEWKELIQGSTIVPLATSIMLTLAHSADEGE